MTASQPETETLVESSFGKGDFARNVLKLAGGAVLAQGITFLVAPVVARLYTPATIGTQNVFVSLVSILSVIICLRYEYAIMLPDTDREAANIAAGSILIATLISIATAAILLWGGPGLTSLLKTPELLPYLWLVPVGLWIQGIFRVMNYWNSRSKHFGRLSIAQVVASLTTSSAQIGMGVSGQATTGSLIGSWIAGTTAYTGVLTIQALKGSWRTLRDGFRLLPILTGLKRYQKFALIDSWGGFVNALSWQLPTLMLSSFFSQTIVGYYALSNRVITMPLTLIGNAIGQVFFQRAAELRQDPAKLSTSVRMVFRVLVALGLLPALVLTIAGKELFMIVFGSNWIEAGIYAQILGLWMFFLFTSSPLGILMPALERQEVALIMQIVILLTRIAALTIGGATHNVYIVLGIWSGTGVLVYGGWTLWNMKIAQVPLASVWAILLRYTLRALPFASILLALKVAFHPSPWLIFCAAIGAVGGYYLLLMRQEVDLYRYLLALKDSRRVS